MFAVRGDNSGWLGHGYVKWTDLDIRPVINLRSDITISSGNGTLENPYIVA